MRALILGIVIWLVGTIAIRFAGQHILHALHPLALYAISFVAMALLVPRILSGDRRANVTLLMLPTLVLDPLACIYFTAVYPNLDPSAAGLFGGWMLIFCGGAVTGVWLAR